MHEAFANGMTRMRGTGQALAGEHNDPAFQSDFVRRLRVAVKMFLARAWKEHYRGKEARADRFADAAGGYYAEYRQHWAHFLRLKGK